MDWWLIISSSVLAWNSDSTKGHFVVSGMVSPQAMVRTSKGLLSSDVLMHGEPDTPPHVEVTEWLYLKKKNLFELSQLFCNEIQYAQLTRCVNINILCFEMT